MNSLMILMRDAGPCTFDGHAVVFRRHARARRYTLRLNREGELAVTIPRGGTRREALRFIERNRTWIDGQRMQRADSTGHRPDWRPGMSILLRGRAEVLTSGTLHGRPFVTLGSERMFVADAGMNLRRPVENHLLELARRELPERTRELASEVGVKIRAVSIRNQASRWGSCSTSGVISLNWRLVQAPAWVRDYLIVHELMHRREMNHSMRFWRLVAAAHPRWRQAETWLDSHATELGF